MIRSYAEVALSNFINSACKLAVKTWWPNSTIKRILMKLYGVHSSEPDTYVALLDIDNFDHINRAYSEVD